MKRKSLDTNAVARLMCRNVPQQYDLIKKMVISGKVRYFVSDITLFELAHVLSIHYEFSREQVRRTIEDLMSINTIDCNRELTMNTLRLYSEHDKLSYADCYLAASAEFMNAPPLWTFDKDLAKRTSLAKLI